LGHCDRGRTAAPDHVRPRSRNRIRSRGCGGGRAHACGHRLTRSAIARARPSARSRRVVSMPPALRELFGVEKPVIAMAHLPPMPGTPLYDEIGGPRAIVESVARDVEILTGSGFDAILFCNEGDRPYQLKATFEGVAMM